MKAIIVMFDSLNRHMLAPYGSDAIHAPNFARLANLTLQFDNCYAGSMPCMPARREMHTGRYNFLHRSWGPLEPFDDSMPELLGRAGVHTHLASDHPHYWEDGGATYHSRYTTWEFLRGQEGDPWKGHVDRKVGSLGMLEKLRGQDDINRSYQRTEAEHSQTLTFDAGLHFLETNVAADNWMLQIECFDPHEPFFTYEQYKELYPHEYDGPPFDWPGYQRTTEPQETIDHVRYEYAALVSMCDRSLGRVLDFMDSHNMWEDTMLLVNTDHGYLLGEHGWWAKSVQPWFNELVHLPMFLWDPRVGRAGERTGVLVQTIDIAPTLLDYFGVPAQPDMLGAPLTAWLDEQQPPRPGALFGIHGGHVNVTDGRYVYMRASHTPDNAPLEELTLMPTHMRSRFSVAELADMTLVAPYSFTKGTQVLSIPGKAQINPYLFGTLLFDLTQDPQQLSPLEDDELELRMLRLLSSIMHEHDAPRSQFERLGIPYDHEPQHEHLLVRAQKGQAEQAAQPMPSLETFPSGTLNIGTPLAQLLTIPSAAHVLGDAAPALVNSEWVSALGSASLYQLAAMGIVPIPALHHLAAALAAIES